MACSTTRLATVVKSWSLFERVGTALGILPFTEILAEMADLRFADNETLLGAMDGANLTFTLAHAPNPPASLLLLYNGVGQLQDVSYTLSDHTVTWLGTPPPNEREGDWLRAWYRY
jgi:hypothetical protein